MQIGFCKPVFASQKGNCKSCHQQSILVSTQWTRFIQKIFYVFVGLCLPVSKAYYQSDWDRNFLLRISDEKVIVNPCQMSDKGRDPYDIVLLLYLRLCTLSRTFESSLHKNGEIGQFYNLGLFLFSSLYIFVFLPRNFFFAKQGPRSFVKGRLRNGGHRHEQVTVFGKVYNISDVL